MKITAKQYAQTLYDLTDGKPKAETEKAATDFARYIYRNRKLKLTGKIIEQFSEIYNKRHSIVRAEVTGAKNLSEEMTKEIKGFIKKKYKAEEAELVIMVDEGLKGGIILKVGDEVMDSSISGRLSELKKILVK
ncbi:MAG: ATP synthase F1 subunit delta [Candidatus Moranbacteria bacterium]|nr:ATP synthase F1 subunit delta [Candidatus Moranbacteria bacterium]